MTPSQVKMMGPVSSFMLMCFLMLGGVVFLSAESKKSMRNAAYEAGNGLTCIMCDRGERVERDCTVNNTQSSCQVCTPGTYQEDITRNYTCNNCTECEKNEEIYRNCTTIRNALCRCKAGYGSRTDDAGNSSSRCFKCPAGDQVDNMTEARHCKPGCSSRVTERDGSSGECRRCANCTLGNLPPTLNCTTVHDAECPPESTGRSPGENAGISIGVIIVFIIIGLLMVYCCCKYRKSSKEASCRVDRIRKQLENKLCCDQDPETAGGASSSENAEVLMEGL